MDSLISMPITLPEKFGTCEDSLVDDENTARCQLDLYFHTCNWLREIISGFLQAREIDVIKQFVKKRLKQLIQFQAQLDVLLRNAPSSYLPPCLNSVQNGHKNKAFKRIIKSLSI
jgi:Fanconi anaemia protein FancD2 nuclease